MPDLQVVLRYLVFAAFAASVLVALASWLVRTRRISPFGPLGRTLRAASDPLIRPIEARLVRAGGNPVHAGWWLAVAVAVAGVVFITLWNLLVRSEEHTSELQSQSNLVCRLLLEKKTNTQYSLLISL